MTRIFPRTHPLLPLAVLAAPLHAQGPLDSELVTSGLHAPVWVTSPAADDRLFVCEQYTGLVRIVEDGQLLPSPFLDLPSVTTLTTGFEQGLLGLAFHPDYTANGYLFVSYVGAEGRSQVDRFQVSATDPYLVDHSTRINLLDVFQPFENHNGGCVAFGPDGYLYLGLGDGGGAGDPDCRAQDGQQLLGKLLRLDVDAIDGTGTYGIPADNPFVGDGVVLDEVFHLGLRNPWRFSFDRKTGDLYIGDVGQEMAEEIDAVPAYVGGLNFGWKIEEGSLCYGSGNCAPTTPSCGSPSFTDPVWTYDHTADCSVTGGFVYRGSAIPEFLGRYVFGDYCSANVWSLDWAGAPVAQVTDHTADLAPGGGLDIVFITTFGEDWRGELYVCELWQGELFRIVPAGPAGTAPALDARFERLSIAGGGVQGLTLDAGPAFAGGVYVVLGSASGTAPGLPVDGLVVPLNLDAYLLATLNSLNKGPYVRTFGVLDADGRADALIRLAPGLAGAGLAGTTLDHAFCVIDPVFGTLQFSSNAAPLELIP